MSFPPERVSPLAGNVCVRRNLALTEEVDRKATAPGCCRRWSLSKNSSVSIKMPVISRIPTVPLRLDSQSTFTGVTIPAHYRRTSRKMVSNGAPVPAYFCTTQALPLVSPLLPNTLSGPEQSHSKSKETQSKTSPKYSPFISTHIGAPCSVGAMDHILDCGHKVFTSQPEECARNCDPPCERLIPSNPSRSAQPFTCMACITEEVATTLANKAASFREELQMVARETGRADPTTWIKNKITIVQMAWRDQSIEEIEVNMAKGRMANPFYIAPEILQLVEEARQRRSLFSMEDVRRADDETLSESASSESDDEPSQSSVWTSPATSATSVSLGLSAPRSRIPMRKR